MRRIDLNQHVYDKGVDINMSPLIDVVFLLLIFFIVTTVFVKETGIDVQKPTATSVRDLDKSSILFALTQNGDIVFGGRTITLNEVRGIVSQQLRNQDASVIVIGDTRAQMGNLVDLIDECKLAGARQVSIAAQRAL